MSGSGAEKRSQAMAIRAYNLREEGYTFRQIAEMIGKKPEQIALLILKGQRLADNRAVDQQSAIE